MLGLFKRRAVAPVVNITVNNDESALLFDAMEEAHDQRVTELLNHSNEQLQQIRNMKLILRLAAQAAGQNDIGACRALLGEYA